MRYFHTIAAIVALVSIVFAGSAFADASPLQHCLAQKAESEDFSGVIAAGERGRTLAFLARGHLAGKGSAAITARTRFNLGSASKMFTATAVGQLIDGGKVRFDDPIGRFVKGLTPEASRVTVRQLLTHSSGLGDFFQPQNMAAMINARTASDILPLVAAEKPAFAPGSRFAYSNSGFALLGILIERVSGLSYGEYLARNIFGPAGMTDSGLDPKPLATLAIGMTALDPTAGAVFRGPKTSQLQVPPRVSNSGLVLIGPDGRRVTPDHAGARPQLHAAPGAAEGYGTPAGGLFSTVLDMQHFASAFLDRRLTSAATAAALTSPQIVAAPATASRPARYYGYGFGVGTEQGRAWFGHNGGTLGANTELAVFPDDRLTLTVLSNRDPPMATDMFHYLRALILNPSLQATCRTQDLP
jgi:D-alanyl-D-alanine carboxypeptidase